MCSVQYAAFSFKFLVFSLYWILSLPLIETDLKLTKANKTLKFNNDVLIIAHNYFVPKGRKQFSCFQKYLAFDSRI